jgi:hypothetical protein
LALKFAASDAKAIAQALTFRHGARVPRFSIVSPVAWSTYRNDRLLILTRRTSVKYAGTTMDNVTDGR